MQEREHINSRRIMIPKTAREATILIVEDVQETRDAIEALLSEDGYRVEPARNETDAIQRASQKQPDAVLISLGGPLDRILRAASNIRERGGLTERTPIVIFSLSTVSPGSEKDFGGNVYVTAPDNFDQLRALLARVLYGESPKA